MDVSGVKLIGFDMDGTLFDSFSVSFDALREGFEAFWEEMGEDGPIPSWETLKNLIGLPSYEFFPSALPESHKDHWELLHKHIGNAEKQRLSEGRGKCFDGVHETLGELASRGYILACLTNASRRYFDAVLDGCELRGFFREMSYLGEDMYRSKTDVLSSWSIEYGGGETLIYIGDRRGDIEAAHGAGVRAIGVTWGYGASKELAPADRVIDRVTELLEIFPNRKK